MSKEVVIKSNRYGINLILDNQVPFQELLRCVGKKFQESGDFFKDSKMAISFRNRELTTEEQQEIIDVISENSAIRIVSIVEDDPVLEARMKEQVKAADKAEEAKAAGEETGSGGTAEAGTAGAMKSGKALAMSESGSADERETSVEFYKGNLRSGQVLRSASDITLVGDVNPGAKIVAAGNIVVLGSLKGNAWAGAEGDQSCFIYALEMKPLQLQIGDVIAKSPDKEKGKRSRKREKDAQNVNLSQLATAQGDNIMLEPVSRNILNKL